MTTLKRSSMGVTITITDFDLRELCEENFKDFEQAAVFNELRAPNKQALHQYPWCRVPKQIGILHNIAPIPAMFTVNSLDF